MTTPTLTIKAGREKPLAGHHPWIFSGAVHALESVEPGGLVTIRDVRGRFLGQGYANVKSNIRARVLSWDENETIDQSFWERRIAAAVARRQETLASGETTAVRLIMSEADQLPGLIVDQYGEFLVLQALTAGVALHLPQIVLALQNVVKPRGIIERSDDHVRDLEGLPKLVGLLAGQEPPAGGVEILENGLKFLIDLMAGHKTGFYLDQRQSHARLRQLVAGRDCLDCFTYTGGFTLNLAAGGAKSILSVDSSAPAILRLQENLALNGLADAQRFTQETADVFQVLRRLNSEGAQFDLIVLDPPKFAAKGDQVAKAARGYKDINLLAFRMLRPGGYLATYSCSGHISADLFQKIIFGASLDAGREAQILEPMSQASDHPVLLSFPESMYLKGLLCRVI